MNIALVWAGAAVALALIASWTGLRAWRGWLELRRLQMAAQQDCTRASDAGPGARIEIADLRERLRRLEKIARGVDL